MMTQSADLLAEQMHSPGSRRFRVQDNARALWAVMAVLLVSGFAVLRLLTGAADTPKVDHAIDSELAQPLPAIEMPTDVYRLRPQTSATLPSASRLDSGDLTLLEDDDWNHLPAASWQTIPIEGFEEEAGSMTDLARQPELFR